MRAMSKTTKSSTGKKVRKVGAGEPGEIAHAFGVLKHRGKRRLSIEAIKKISAKGWSGGR